MKLTSKARYAVMAVADLALYSFLEKNSIVLREIAERQEISVSYLEQLFAKLRKAGVITSIRGPVGGYRLARDANQISVWDIVTAVDETIELNRCLGTENCTYGYKCITHNLWNDLTNNIKNYLQTTTIGNIVRNHISDETASQTVIEKINNWHLEKKLRGVSGYTNSSNLSSSRRDRKSVV